MPLGVREQGLACPIVRVLARAAGMILPDHPRALGDPLPTVPPVPLPSKPPSPSGARQEPAGPGGISGERCPGARGPAAARRLMETMKGDVLEGKLRRLVQSPCGGAEAAEVARVSFPF